MKLYFNESLVPLKYKNIPKYRNLVKLLLFIVKEEIEIRNVLLWKIVTSGMSMSIDFSEDIISELQEIVLELEKLGIIERNYKDTSLIRWVMSREIYVQEIVDTNITDEQIKEVRSYFSKKYTTVSGRASTKELVKKELQIFLESNPDITIEEIIPSLKYYVDVRMASNSDWVGNIIKVVNNKNDPEMHSKDLKYFIHEYRDSGGYKSTFIE